VSLPNPLPDNPQRWDGWKSYNSANLYERLGLSIDSNASTEQIEENTRILLVWWQKKLPLKNQPSNPLSQLLRTGLDEAPVYLAEARTILLDPVSRRNRDIEMRSQAVSAATTEFKKLIDFTLANKRLLPEDEERLIQAGSNLGLSRPEAAAVVEAEVARTGSVREVAAPPPPPKAAPISSSAPETPEENGARDPFQEFRKLLRMSKLCADGDDMSDDQRDAMCNLGESLGLTGGQAEDLIDEYLEDAATMPMNMTAPRVMTQVRNAAPVSSGRGVAVAAPPRPVAAPIKPATGSGAVQGKQAAPVVTPLMRAQEREKYPNFVNALGAELILVTSGKFLMGSTVPEAQPNEQPVTPTSVSRFFISRFPITNAQYERFDAAHAAKRAPWADANHPVVYVSALEAEKFCAWLSKVEGRRYRLPSEAEWEYAARASENRNYPWGEQLNAGWFANFADARSNFPWRDARLDDGWAQSSPVGAFPKGASPFGLEDVAGNVFEWCLDGFGPYKGKEVTNPKGPREGGKRIYRGGSWKSRAASLRASARNFNQPDYSSNDVGFRIVCECD